MRQQLSFGSSAWVDLENPSENELDQIVTEFQLSHRQVHQCLEPDHLPAFQRTAKGGFLMLRAFDETAPTDADDVQRVSRKVAVFWGDSFLITIHRSHLGWLAGVWDAWAGATDRDPTKLNNALYETIEEALYSYEQPIDQANVTIERLEDSMFRDSSSSAPSHLIEAAFHAKKRATLFKRLLRLTRDAIPSVSRLGDPASPAIQRLKEEAERLFFYADDLVETSNDLVQLSISLSANRSSSMVRMLTLVSIFLLPLNLVTGIYGMNFEHMPELHLTWGYPAVLGIMVVIEIALFAWLYSKNWMK